MSDILSKNNTLPMLNGDFVLVDRIELIRQHICTALNTMYGDWLLDPDKGIDYAGGLRNLTFLDHDVKNQIKGVKGVVSIQNYKRTFDKENLTVLISAVVETIYGNLPIDEVINK